MLYDIFRWLAIITAYPALALYFKTKIYYEDKSVCDRRIKGGALIVSNHFGTRDYIVNMFALLPRKLYVVASELPYRNKLNAFGMRFFGGIQANRTTRSMRFVGESVKVIRNGRLVQIFPEGRNTDDGTVKPFKPSYLLIAVRANAPIIPIVTDGNYGFFKRAHILIGKPIYPSDLCASDNPKKAELLAMNEVVYAKVKQLKQSLDSLK